MKCRKCGNKAVINMRQHKLALCKDHFPMWVREQTDRTIKKYHMFNKDDRILVAVSGGKDSLSLWDILWRLGYNVDGLYIDLGIDGQIAYSKRSQSLAERFAEQRNLILHIISIPKEYGVSIPEMSERSTRGREKPCSVCGITKRHVMNSIALEGHYDVLATGHNLDDEVAVLFSNTLSWKSGFLVRQGPVLRASNDGLVRKVKPLCRFYEREMAAYAILTEIAYIYDECPFAEGAKSIYYKELLNQLEADRPGAKQNFYLSFLKAKADGLFSLDADSQRKDLHPCPVCGQPTTAPNKCTFCRLVESTSASS